MNKNTINICLAWHNLNSSNFGVSALAISQVYLILKAADLADVKVKLTTLGTPDISSLNIRQKLESDIGITIDHVEFSVKRIIKEFVKFDFHILSLFNQFDVIMDIGEGDSFTDIYGLRRFVGLSLTKAIPILQNKRLVLSPQTIGPFNNKIAYYVSKWLLKNADLIFSRDYKSTQFVDDMGIKCTEVSDVAFTLPFEVLPKNKDTLGLNISGLLYNGGYSGNNQFGLSVDYKHFVTEVIKEFRKRKKTIYLVSHVLSDSMVVEDDYRICEQIKKLFLNDDGVVVAPKFKTPIEAKTFISQLEFFTGSRMHATIAALSSGVVTVPIAYSRKFSGVFGSLGYNYTLDAYSLNTNELINQLFRYYDEEFNEMEKAMEVARTVSLERNELYIQDLSRVFSNA